MSSKAFCVSAKDFSTDSCIKYVCLDTFVSAPAAKCRMPSTASTKTCQIFRNNILAEVESFQESQCILDVMSSLLIRSKI